jgi:hypothetical protein
MMTRTHFQVLFDLLYGPSPYSLQTPASSMVDQLRAAAGTLVMVIRITRGGSLPSSKRTLAYLNGPFFSRFRDHRDRSEFESTLLKEFPRYLQFVLSSLTFLSDVCEYANVPSSTCAKLLSACEEIRTDLERQLRVRLPVSSPEHRPVAAKIGEAIERVKKTLEGDFTAANGRMRALRFQSHTCTACKLRPAGYYAEPCMHPSLCAECADRLCAAGSIYCRCYACGAKVANVRPFRYLVMDD